MAHSIEGYLLGIVQQEFKIYDHISNAKILALPLEEEISKGGFVNLHPSREGAKFISEEDFLNAADSKIVYVGVSDNGRFTLEAGGYQGQSLALYVAINQVPLPGGNPNQRPLPKTAYLFMGEFTPVVSEERYHVSAMVAKPLWCGLKKKADVWTIIGKVQSSEQNIPLENVAVAAYDVDITQDDALGTANTNSNGIFRIDYPGAAFRKGTILDIELFGGPDIFFKVKDQENNLLLDEPRSRGRHSDREDRGPCFFVNLYADVPVPEVGLAPAWTGIGSAFTIPDGGSLNDFDAEGYAGAKRYALTSNIQLTGQAPIATAGGRPVEYRFLLSALNSVAPNGAAPLPEASFTRVVGKAPHQNLFVPVRLGQMVTFSPTYKVVNVFSTLSDLDSEGWLDVNTSIFRTFSTRPDLNPGDISNYAWVDDDSLMGLATAQVTQAANADTSGLTIGDDLAPAAKIDLEKVAVRFEIREVIDKAANLFASLPGHGTTLNSMVVNNNPAVVKVGVAEQIASGDPCGELSGGVHVVYTAYHPHIEDVSVRVENNSGSYDVSLTEGSTGTDGVLLPLVNNNNTTVQSVYSGVVGFQLPDGPSPVPVLTTCSYITTLRVHRRLHTGNSQVLATYDQASFYYQS